MTANSAASLGPDNGNNLLATVLPNRGRTRFLRGVFLLFLAFGLLGSISIAVTVLLELHARYTWPVAHGVIVTSDLKSNKGQPGNLNRRTNYWVEYQVKFSVPVSECLTGTTSADSLDPMPCWGTVMTRSTESWSTAKDWLVRHPLNSEVAVLHDPSGPRAKIARESLWLVYPWKSIFGIAIWVTVFLILVNITQRRLRQLELLPEDYDASPPSAEPPRRDDLIDMNLS